jgi:hypothetical protein
MDSPPTTSDIYDSNLKILYSKRSDSAKCFFYEYIDAFATLYNGEGGDIETTYKNVFKARLDSLRTYERVGCLQYEIIPTDYTATDIKSIPYSLALATILFALRSGPTLTDLEIKYIMNGKSINILPMAYMNKNLFYNPDFIYGMCIILKIELGDGDNRYFNDPDTYNKTKKYFVQDLPKLLLTKKNSDDYAEHARFKEQVLDFFESMHIRYMQADNYLTKSKNLFEFCKYVGCLLAMREHYFYLIKKNTVKNETNNYIRILNHNVNIIFYYAYEVYRTGCLQQKLQSVINDDSIPYLKKEFTTENAGMLRSVVKSAAKKIAKRYDLSLNNQLRIEYGLQGGGFVLGGYSVAQALLLFKRWSIRAFCWDFLENADFDNFDFAYRNATYFSNTLSDKTGVKIIKFGEDPTFFYTPDIILLMSTLIISICGYSVRQLLFKKEKLLGEGYIYAIGAFVMCFARDYFDNSPDSINNCVLIINTVEFLKERLIYWASHNQSYNLYYLIDMFAMSYKDQIDPNTPTPISDYYMKSTDLEQANLDGTELLKGILTIIFALLKKSNANDSEFRNRLLLFESEGYFPANGLLDDLPAMKLRDYDPREQKRLFEGWKLPWQNVFPSVRTESSIKFFKDVYDMLSGKDTDKTREILRNMLQILLGDVNRRNVAIRNLKSRIELGQLWIGLEKQLPCLRYGNKLLVCEDMVVQNTIKSFFLFFMNKVSSPVPAPPA